MKPHPRIAVCCWSLKPQDHRDLVRRLRRLEIGGVQLALSPLVEAGVPAAVEAIDEIRSAGIEIVSGMMAMAGEDYSTLESIALTGGLRPDATWPRNREHAEAVATLAEEAGIDLVTFHAGFLPELRDDPERATLLSRLREIADVFSDRDVDLGLETGQETASTLADVLEDLARSNVGVNFDPANMILYGKDDPIGALAALRPYVVQLHIKDAVPTRQQGTWGTEVPVGAGAVDWDEFLAIARGFDPPVDFVIEREAGDSREEDIARARDLLVSGLAGVE